jgi:hypothetical protein
MMKSISLAWAFLVLGVHVVDHVVGQGASLYFLALRMQ